MNAFTYLTKTETKISVPRYYRPTDSTREFVKKSSTSIGYFGIAYDTNLLH